MQKEHQETPKRRIRRSRNAATPDHPKKNNVHNTTNVRAGSSRLRSTMAPSDFLNQTTHKDLCPRRRVVTDRMSILPTQLSMDGARPTTSELDNDNVQLGLLHAEYQQGLLTSVCFMKRLEEDQHRNLTTLASLAKERDHDEEQLFKLRTREVDIVQLSAAMNELDTQVLDVNKFASNKDIKTLEETLSKLYTYLEPLDILQCRNIILPKTTSDWEETEKLLVECIITLQSIAEIIGTKGEGYRSVYNGIKEFIETYSNVEGYQKRLQMALCDLQVLVLKTVSLSLKDDDDVTDTDEQYM